jgi:putative ABC transport system substrate-binding protein
MRARQNGARLRRRAFVGSLARVGASAAVLLGLFGGCQQFLPGQRRVARIGTLTGASLDDTVAVRDAFTAAMRDLGWSPGDNLILESRSSDLHDERFTDLAAELVRIGVEAIVVSSSAAALGAAQATSTTLIVTAEVQDPVGIGLAVSFARPGGNVTGVTTFSDRLAAKRLELLRGAVPALTRVGVIWNPTNPAVNNEGHQVDIAAAALGLHLLSLEVSRAQDVPHAFDIASQANLGGLVVIKDPVTFAARNEIAALAAQGRLPAIYRDKGLIDAGGLMAYGVGSAALWRQSARYVDKILRGANPGDLPLEQPRDFEFIVNVKAARALGLTIPPDVAAQVTEWVS